MNFCKLTVVGFLITEKGNELWISPYLPSETYVPLSGFAG